MILFLYGQDSFRSRQYLRQLVEQFKKQRDPQGYNVVFVDAKKEPGGKIFAEISAAPFLAEKRMIIIENLLSNNDQDLLEVMLEKMKAPALSENNVVIFWQGEALSKVKEAKELQAMLGKEKYAQEFAPLVGAKLSAWIEKEVQSRGGVIARDARDYLSRNAGHDMWRLSSLIDQLAAYTKKEIALAAVQIFLEEKIDGNIFNLVEAVVSGNQKLAFKLLQHQRNQGEEEGKIFGMLAWQCRILLQMADALECEGNMPSDALAKKLGLHPFVAKKNLALVRRYSLAQLQRLHQRLLDIDTKTKTGQADQSLLVDLFVASSLS